jgi:glycosyltransferase involved in cell wall biosynthesis
MPNAFLTIAGFGPLQEELGKRAHRLGIASRIHFLGAVPQMDLPALYRRAAVLVAPFQRTASGDQEGLPVVLMEAIGCGCPVIAGDVPGVRELLGEDADDFCVPQNDVAMLAEAIGRILSAPTSAVDRAARIRGACAQWIDWQPVATAYATLLKAAMDPRSVRGA